MWLLEQEVSVALLQVAAIAGIPTVIQEQNSFLELPILLSKSQ
jgi:hypothetical protein